jgi:hypothetical protein
MITATRLEWLKDTAHRLAETLGEVTTAQKEFIKGTQSVFEKEQSPIVHLTMSPSSNTEITLRIDTDQVKKSQAEVVAQLQFAATEVGGNMEAIESTMTELDLNLKNFLDQLDVANKEYHSIATALENLSNDLGSDPAKAALLDQLAILSKRAWESSKQFAILLTYNRSFLREDDGPPEPKGDGGASSSEEAPKSEKSDASPEATP